MAHRHCADAMRLGPRDRLVCGPHRQHLADAVVAVQHGNRARIDHNLGGGDRVHHAMAEAVEVPAES
jgi:hypothetical protein